MTNHLQQQSWPLLKLPQAQQHMAGTLQEGYQRLLQAALQAQLILPHTAATCVTSLRPAALQQSHHQLVIAALCSRRQLVQQLVGPQGEGVHHHLNGQRGPLQLNGAVGQLLKHAMLLLQQVQSMQLECSRNRNISSRHHHHQPRNHCLAIALIALEMRDLRLTAQRCSLTNHL